MTDHQWLLRIVTSAYLILTCSLLGACGNTFTWQEEVLLHDGRKIIVERSEIYDSRIPHEFLTQDAPLSESKMTFISLARISPLPGKAVTIRFQNQSF